MATAVARLEPWELERASHQQLSLLLCLAAESLLLGSWLSDSRNQGRLSGARERQEKSKAWAIFSLTRACWVGHLRMITPSPPPPQTTFHFPLRMGALATAHKPIAARPDAATAVASAPPHPAPIWWSNAIFFVGMHLLALAGIFYLSPWWKIDTRTMW